MIDLLVAFGLVLVIEGLLWGLAPATALKLLEAASEMPLRTLSLYGWASVLVGVAIVWIVRG